MCYSVTQSASFRPVLVAAVSVLALFALAACDSSSGSGGMDDFELGAFEVGDMGPAEGIIIFVDENEDYEDFIYIEAAPEDLEVDGSSIHNWGPAYTDPFYVNNTLEDFGAGESNTALVVAAMEEADESGRAAQLVDAYSHAGFNDWYLPSKNELEYMCEEIHLDGEGEFDNTFYWSSSDESIQQAWSISFSASFCTESSAWKTNNSRVRPIRSF